MSTYTIESIVGQEGWTGREGQGMVTYELMLQGEGQTVGLIKQATSPPPSAGDTVDGFIESGSRGRRLKVNRQNGAGSRSSTTGGGGYNDPKTVARISRSHSQEMALRLIFASGDAATMDLSNKDLVGTYLNNVVKPLVDWFDKDKAAAGDAA